METTSYTYGADGLSVSATTKNASGATTGIGSESINVSTNAVFDDIKGFSGGAQINEQQLSGYSNNVSVDVISGNGAVANISNAAITMTGSSKATINGTGDTINALGGNTITLTGSNDTISGGGTHDTVYVAAGVAVTDKNSGDVINTAANDAITATGDTINVGGNLAAGAASGTTIISGTGDTINISNANITVTAGSSVTIVGSGDTITEQNGASVVVNGDSNTATLSSGSYIDFNGWSEVVSKGTSGATIDVGTHSWVTDLGTANTIGFAGSFATITASSDTIKDDTVGGDYMDSLTGSNDVISMTAGSSLGVSGNNDTATLSAGSKSWIPSALTITGSNESVGGSGSLTLQGITSVTDTSGTLSSVYLGGSGEQLIASNQQNITNSSTAGMMNEVTGNGDTIGFSLNSVPIALGDGSQNMTLIGIPGFSTPFVYASYGSVNFVGGLGYINGYNETIGATSGETIQVGGKEDVVNATGAIINPLANTTLDINGSNTINVWNSGDGITSANSVVNISGYHVSGDDLYSNNDRFVQSGTGDILNIAGFGNTGALSGDTITWLGATTGDTLTNAGGSTSDVLNLDNYGLSDAPAAPIYSGSWSSSTTPDLTGDNYSNPPGSSSGGVTAEVSEDGDPVILNLRGGSVQSQSLAKSNVFFDEQNNGNRVHTAWGTAGEGYLVYDPDNRNVVVNGQSMVSGFAALAAMDTNHDGMLSALDTTWAHLKVWVDASGTGAIGGGSLATIDSLGIASINLHSTHVNTTNNGNRVLDDSTFTWKTGGTGDIAGVEFAFDPNAINAHMRIPGTPSGPSAR